MQIEEAKCVSIADPAGGRLRRVVGGLLGVGVLVNHLDRISLSVAAPQIAEQFSLSSADMGLLFNAFLALSAFAGARGHGAGPVWDR